MFEKKLTGYASNDKPQNKGAKFWEAHPKYQILIYIQPLRLLVVFIVMKRQLIV